MVTIIQSIFCAQSGASIRLTVWKWSFESRYPWALPPVLENFRGAFSPGPTDCPWVSEDELKQTPLEVSQSAVSLLEDCPLSFQLLGRRNSLLTRTELLFLMICFMVLNIFPSQNPSCIDDYESEHYSSATCLDFKPNHRSFIRKGNRIRPYFQG